MNFSPYSPSHLCAGTLWRHADGEGLSGARQADEAQFQRILKKSGQKHILDHSIMAYF
jgi:hypothetical protein